MVCGAENPDDARFCSKCGKPLTAEAAAAGTQTAPNSVAVTPPGQVPQESRNMVVIMCIASLFVGFISPLLFWLLNNQQAGKEWIVEQSKNMLNFQITVIIAVFVSSLFTIIVIGAFLLPLVLLANVVICILAAVKASRGEGYNYPLTIPFVK